jgi:hypothetical protein
VLGRFGSKDESNESITSTVVLRSTSVLSTSKYVRTLRNRAVIAVKAQSVGMYTALPSLSRPMRV